MNNFDTAPHLGADFILSLSCLYSFELGCPSLLSLSERAPVLSARAPGAHTTHSLHTHCMPSDKAMSFGSLKGNI